MGAHAEHGLGFPPHGGKRTQTTTTLETLKFDRPTRIDFRLVRGQVPHVVESFVLTPTETSTNLTWAGELGTDFWSVGAYWGNKVATAWERTVYTSL